MSYQEKKGIISLISTILIFGFYSWYMFQKYDGGSLDQVDMFKFWGAFVLNLILVSILANIVISILFVIMYKITTHEIVPSFTDELDKIIDLKATRNSHYVFILGFLLSMGSLVLEMPISAMFIILICSGFLSAVVGILTQLYLYRRGV